MASSNSGGALPYPMYSLGAQRRRTAAEWEESHISAYHDRPDYPAHKKARTSSPVGSHRIEIPDSTHNSHSGVFLNTDQPVLGRFLILEVMGRGTFGIVVKALDLAAVAMYDPNRDVARVHASGILAIKIGCNESHMRTEHFMLASLFGGGQSTHKYNIIPLYFTPHPIIDSFIEIRLPSGHQCSLDPLPDRRTLQLNYWMSVDRNAADMVDLLGGELERRAFQTRPSSFRTYDAKAYENGCLKREGELSFLLLDYCCCNLLEIINIGRVLPYSFIQHVGFDILAALGYLHERQYINGDVKPENIMFSPTDPQFMALSRKEAVLAVFASCKAKQLAYFPFTTRLIDFSLCQKRPVAGYIQTRPYRAPEVIIGFPLTTKSDIWSLGCVLGEMAVGRPLFRAKDSVSTLDLQCTVVGPPHIPMEMTSFGGLSAETPAQKSQIHNMFRHYFHPCEPTKTFRWIPLPKRYIPNPSQRHTYLDTQTSAVVKYRPMPTIHEFRDEFHIVARQSKSNGHTYFAYSRGTDWHFEPHYAYPGERLHSGLANVLRASSNPSFVSQPVLFAHFYEALKLMLRFDPSHRPSTADLLHLPFFRLRT